MEKDLLDPTPLPLGTYHSSYLSMVHYLPQRAPPARGREPGSSSRGQEEDRRDLAAPHVDGTLMTFITADRPGLQVFRRPDPRSYAGEWVDVDCVGKVIVLAGVMLETATGRVIPALQHRVEPLADSRTQGRIAAVWKLKARPDAVLDPSDWQAMATAQGIGGSRKAVTVATFEKEFALQYPSINKTKKVEEEEYGGGGGGGVARGAGGGGGGGRLKQESGRGETRKRSRQEEKDEVVVQEDDEPLIIPVTTTPGDVMHFRLTPRQKLGAVFKSLCWS